jgi:hypothetical protein
MKEEEEEEKEVFADKTKGRRRSGGGVSTFEKDDRRKGKFQRDRDSERKKSNFKFMAKFL